MQSRKTNTVREEEEMFDSWKEFLRHLIKERRTTAYGLAKVCSISAPVIYKLSRGDTPHPNAYTVQRLEDGLHIKINEDDKGKITYEKRKERRESDEPTDSINSDATAEVLIQSIRAQTAGISEEKLAKVRAIVKELIEITING